MKTCSRCKRELPREASFCMHCGASQGSAHEDTVLDDARVSGPGAAAQGTGAVAAGEGGAAIGGDVHGDVVIRQDVYTVPSKPEMLDEANALDQYLRHVIESNRLLQLQGIRSARGLVSVQLEEIYITLTVTERRPVAAREGQKVLDETDDLRETAGQVKVDIQEALAAHPRLVVLGHPGSGKTTLVRYLALTYARDLLEHEGLVAQRLELDEHRLPILLPLRDLSRYLETHHPDPSTDGPALLRDYLHTFFTHQDLPLPEAFFVDRLRRGECVVLFDGVDEVADLNTRRRIARLIERFTVAYPDNRYVVTSRIVGYTGSALLGEDYAVTTVRDFTLDDIERFATHWNEAVEVALAGEKTQYALQKAERQTEALLDAIKINDKVRDLAVNPLLLTVIALVQRYRAHLPERRTELYEEAIEVLLGKWDEAKGLTTKTLIAGRELDAGDRRGMLEPVALWMMNERTTEIEFDQLRRQLDRRFSEMVGDEQEARKATRQFLQLISERSGLLAERGQGIYAFSHFTFQEHLAARAIADRSDYISYTISRLGDSWWREVVLLEAGYLSTQGAQRVTALVQAIMNHKTEPEPFHNLVLAAEILHDVGPARVEGHLLGEVRNRLRREVDQGFSAFLAKSVSRLTTSSMILRSYGFIRPHLPENFGSRARRKVTIGVERRTAAARALAMVGEGYWTGPYGEPDWADIPAGDFWMGVEGGQQGDALHRVFLARFRIARVPITNTQYRLFVEATNHTPPKHWEDGRPSRGLESCPVVNVSFDDALDYCEWLGEATGKPISVPSEAEWEKAARGDKDTRAYPWGDRFVPAFCNNRMLGLYELTPVGVFPDGGSPYGCLDMLGNVWEWTRSLWGQRFDNPDFGYPYTSEDGREEPQIGGLRVLRGGSLLTDPKRLRVFTRDRPIPKRSHTLIGFRVVIPSTAPPQES